MYVNIGSVIAVRARVMARRGWCAHRRRYARQTKVTSLLKHVSQYDNATAVSEDIYSLGAMVAAAAGAPGVSHAEAFLHVPMLP